MRDALELDLLLRDHARRFDFFQALRLLECAHPQLPRIGASQRAQDDPVRFGQTPALHFDGAQIDGYRQRADGLAPLLTVNFLGLLGPNGPLPLHLTEYARDRARNAGDPTLARFLDVFHHRMIALFYRAWASAQPTVNLDRDGQDRYSMQVAALIGDGMEPLRNRDAVPDHAKLYFAGLLSSHRHSAEGLCNILRQFLGLPVQIREFVGGWLELASSIRSRLGGPGHGDSLGVSLVLGERAWDAQHKFRIVIGPIGLADYRRLLPGGDSLRRLVDWVRNYLGDALAWDLQLILRGTEVPSARLGGGSQLGWTTWCGTRPHAEDRQDLILNVVP